MLATFLGAAKTRYARTICETVPTSQTTRLAGYLQDFRSIRHINLPSIFYSMSLIILIVHVKLSNWNYPESNIVHEGNNSVFCYRHQNVSSS